MTADGGTRRLAELCEIQPPKSEARKRVDGNVLVSFAPMEDLGVDRKYMRPVQVKALSSVIKGYTYFADGDVLLAKITPCFENGKLGIASDLTHSIGFGSSEFIVLRPKPGLDREYLYYFLSRQEFRDEGASRMSGAVGHQRLSKDFVENYPVPVTPLSEQRRVVGLLDSALREVATSKANTERNLSNARALFRSRLQSIFTASDASWHEMRLSDVCTLINGRAYKKPEMLAGGKYPILRVGNFFTNKNWYYSNLELEADKYCDAGDLLYAWSASFGPRVWDGGKVIYHYHIWKVLPNPDVVEKRFLLRLLEWDVDRIKLAHGTGTTMMHVSKGSMERRVLPVPSLAEQARIVATLDALEDETKRLESLYVRKLAALEMLKESLLNQAFSEVVLESEAAG